MKLSNDDDLALYSRRTCSASLVLRLPRPLNTWTTYRTTRDCRNVRIGVERLLPETILIL